jgi:hypothetical protein
MHLETASNFLEKGLNVSYGTYVIARETIYERSLPGLEERSYGIRPISINNTRYRVAAQSMKNANTLIRT